MYIKGFQTYILTILFVYNPYSNFILTIHQNFASKKIQNENCSGFAYLEDIFQSDEKFTYKTKREEYKQEFKACICYNTLKIPFDERMKVKKLDLSSMGLKDFPSILDSLPNLEFLSMDNNPLSNIKTIPKLSNLKILTLDECSAKNLPYNIYDLRNLQILLLIASAFNSFPEGITKIKTLKYINTWGSKVDLESKIIKLYQKKMKNCVMSAKGDV